MKIRENLCKTIMKEQSDQNHTSTIQNQKKTEYENTIRTLKRKIANLEDTQSYSAKEEINCTPSNSTTYDTNNQSLLQDIHKKVTNYMLKQVDIQIQKLDVDDNEQKRSRNKQNTKDRKENNQGLEQTN